MNRQLSARSYRLAKAVSSSRRNFATFSKPCGAVNRRPSFVASSKNTLPNHNNNNLSRGLTSSRLPSFASASFGTRKSLSQPLFAKKVTVSGGLMSQTRTFAAKKEEKIDFSVYKYRPPIIPPRFRYKREQKKEMAKDIYEFEEYGKGVARTLQSVKKNELRERLKTSLENRIFNAEYKRKIKAPLRAEQAKAFALYQRHREERAIEIQQRRIVKAQEKESAKKEWLRAMVELAPKWENHPTELCYAPYMFHSTFDPRRTKMLLFREMGRSPRVKGTIGQSPVQGQQVW